MESEALGCRCLARCCGPVRHWRGERTLKGVSDGKWVSKDPLTVVKVGRSGSQRVVGVLVSILQRMAWVVLEGEGELGEWDVARGGRRSAVVAAVVAGCAVC